MIDYMINQDNDASYIDG